MCFPFKSERYECIHSPLHYVAGMQGETGHGLDGSGHGLDGSGRGLDGSGHGSVSGLDAEAGRAVGTMLYSL